MSRTVRLVLADDHVVLRVGLRAFLEEQHDPEFQIVGEASSGEEVLALDEKERPDLVLLDLQMNGLGGLETTHELRKRQSRTRILVLTQFAEGVYLKRLLEAGANGYILKSARGEELVAAIRAVLAGGTYIDPSLASTIVSKAYGDEKPSGDEEMLASLTAREVQVLTLVAEGLSNKEIADKLDVAVKTVMAHRANLMEKLHIHNHSKLVQFAIRAGLVTVG